MATLNKVQLIGYLGGAPKMITTKNGEIKMTAGLATQESFKQNGEWQTKPQWHHLVFFGKLAKAIEHLHKGSLLFVEGKLQSVSWVGKDKSTYQESQIVVNQLQVLVATDKAHEDKLAAESLAYMRKVVNSPMDYVSDN